jgi:hypothetical protein
MLDSQPLVGVGLNQFTSRVEQYTQIREVVRFVQPVHHLGLLWLAETGLLGLMFLLWVLLEIKNKKLILPILILLPIAVLDHYLLTQNQGLLLGVVLFSLLD